MNKENKSFEAVRKKDNFKTKRNILFRISDTITTKQGVENGVTLISLVVTIVILIILAAVSINMIIGDNGILTQAEEAKKKTEEAEKNQKEGFNNLYNEMAEIAGVTIGSIYDDNNNPESEDYNENAMHIGDYVNYTAGTWSESKEDIEAYECGGYVSGQSRDSNAIGLDTTYEGWRIFDISEDKKTITLISAGCPERYQNSGGYYSVGYKEEYILTGIKNITDTTNITDGVTPRKWDMYINSSKYAKNAKALTKELVDEWYNKYIDNTVTDVWEADIEMIAPNKMITVLSNKNSYFLASAFIVPGSAYGTYASTLWSFNNEEKRFWDGYHLTIGNRAAGLRVLVTLDSNVKFNATPEKITQDGFTYNKWTIR